MAREVNGSDAVDQAEDVPMEGAGWLSMQNLTTLRKGATQDLSRLASVLSSKAQSLVSTSPVLKGGLRMALACGAVLPEKWLQLTSTASRRAVFWASFDGQRCRRIARWMLRPQAQVRVGRTPPALAYTLPSMSLCSRPCAKPCKTAPVAQTPPRHGLTTGERHQPPPVHAALRRQEEFNRISLSLTGVNYMMNMAGRQANDSLRREVEDGRAKIDLLHESVQDQSIVIDTLNDSLSELRVHASQQEREAERLRRDLRERSRSLTSSLEQVPLGPLTVHPWFDKRVALHSPRTARRSQLHASIPSQLRRQAMSQQYVITSQQSALESMRQRKLKQDGIVDMVASAISLFLYG